MLSDPSQPELHDVEFIACPQPITWQARPTAAIDVKKVVRICRLIEDGWSVTKACEAESVKSEHIY
jgi:hypothetical protein